LNGVSRDFVTLLERIPGELAEFKHYFSNARIEILLGGFGIASSIVVARGLGPSGRGQLAAAMVWPSLVTLLASMELNHAFVYSVGTGWAAPERLKRFGFRYALAVGIPAMVAYWFICPFLLRKQFPEASWVPGVFALSIPLSLLTGLLLAIYQGGGQYRAWNIGRLFRGGAWTTAAVVLWCVAGLTVLGLLLAQLAILAVLAVGLYARAGTVPSHVKEGSEAPAGAIFRYGRAVYLSSIAYMINQQLDQLLLTFWVDPSDLGQYASAVTISGVLLLVSSAISPILFSEMARSSGDPLLQKRHQSRALSLAAAVLLPLGAVVTLAGPALVTWIYGTAFGEAGRLLRVMAPASIFLGIGNVLSYVLRGAGRPMDATYGLGVGVVLTVVGLVVALPRYGIWGAAWVSLVAYGSMAAVQFLMLRRWEAGANV
jgi:O-antigen/teichoic acid export membrane protein